jgi:hypothetical protein
MLVDGDANSWTYVVTLGFSFSIVERLVMNQGSSLAWQMGGHNTVNYIVGSPAI